MKLPILARIIFSVTIVMTAIGMIVFGTSYVMDPEYYSSEIRTIFVTQMVSGTYFFVFSVAALSNWFWGIAGYRIGLVATGLHLVFSNFYGESHVIGIIFMLVITVLQLGFLFAIWKYLGTNDVMAAYAQQVGSINSEKPGASLH